MHHPAPTSSELGFLPAMYSFSGPTSLPEFDLGSPSTSRHLQRATLSNNWETRCLRKHRRRIDDEGCSAKRRRLMFGAEVDVSENSNTSTHDWPTANSCSPLPAQRASSDLPQRCPESPNSTLPQPSAALPRPEPESSCMEIEAAQRKLQEIEDRITLEDDDEDEDLDVEPAPRRPVLVISDSLKEGLQRGISDILPHTVAQSVSHSCMELVLWRPPDDPFCRKQKGSLQKQRKQQTVSRQPPTRCPSPTPHGPLSPSSPPADTHSSPYSFPVAHSSGEEDMEM
ncbi:coiled-coil domain-containing protein 117 isoform X2 [Cottoperca gobio]|uniref:Coiled-coil domain-containing protein 117 isoform X2 n=2 Tax=Cottoperca gobio TaxID=56716 RepID=A0A6J2QBE1_COTGO|nr:coiled-coil domain-containing protein 117 isoform X2 [Cottoperca gobio]